MDEFGIMSRLLCMVVLVMWGVASGGCMGAGTPLPDTAGSGASQEVLVTFHVPSAPPAPHAGSQRNYHGALPWDADLLTRQRVKQFARDHDLLLKGGWRVDALGLYCAAFYLPESTSLAQVQQQARRLAYVHRVQPNNAFRGMGTVRRYNDPLFNLQFGEHADKLLALHQFSRGENVRVGVIDSQVDMRHPDLIGQITAQEKFDTESRLRDLKHGTAMAGIIAAADDNRQGVVGVAPGAEVHIFGACNAASEAVACDSFSIAKALEAAIEADIQVLNMSLAGPQDPLLEDLINVAHAGGMIVVAAANEG